MKKFFAIALCGAVGLIAALPSANAQQKTAKACQEEWRANKAANQAAKITEKDYVAKCRSEAAKPAATTPPPAPTKLAPATAAPKTTTPPPTTAAKPAAPKPAIASTGTNQFTTEAQAKARCPTDTVVYVNLLSKIYHFAGHKDYGNLKSGAYMCEKDTAAAGARAAKNEKHP